jgi:TRAP-type C4-dicarboxylate transport system substrate-binding protein
MRKKVFLAVCAVVLFAFPAFGADVIKMDLNAIYGHTNFQTEGTMEFAKLVEKYTSGGVQITVHPGGALGFKGPELLKVVKDGQVPMSDILMGVVAGSDQVFGVSSLPRLVMSYEDARKLYEACRPLYEKASEKWNQKFLYASPWPPSGMVTKNEINAVADLKGLKTRTYDKNGAEFLSALGGGPLSLPWGEVYSSLRTGMIDSVLTSAVSTKDGKFWEVLAHFKKINYAYPLNMVTINMDYWKALSKEQQEAMIKAAKETEDFQWKNSHDQNEEALKAIQENGIKVSDANPDLNQNMNQAAKKIIDAFMAEAGDDLKAAVKPFLP